MKEISAFKMGKLNLAYASYFDGKSYLNRLLASPIAIANVTFEPSCRNHWHVHKAKKGGGQILICVHGYGWYQEWGKEPISLKEGDALYIPPNVKHWHGAQKDGWFQHLAFEVPGEETSTEWLEPVSDEDYDKLEENDG